MKSTNIPEVKLGIVAVSRDCFPIQLSEKRRAAIVAACQAKGLDLYEAKTTVENEKDMEEVYRGWLQCSDRFPGQLWPRNSGNPDRKVLQRPLHVCCSC